MMEKAGILSILKTGRSVFTFKEILLASGEKAPALLRRRVHYYIKQGDLYPLRRGIYGRDRNYDRRELAVRIFTPSYISFETVLAEAGIVFQHYGQVFAASYLTREIRCDKGSYVFRKIKDRVLTDPLGVENRERYSIASKERAFLDTVYLHKEYHFDNLSPLDWDRVLEILPIYDNQRVNRAVQAYHRANREDSR